MKVVAYNIQDFERETLAKANAKVHDITFISNPLSKHTVHYAEGKEVIIVSERDFLDKELLDLLVRVGVKKIISRSVALKHIDEEYAGKLHLHLANTPLSDSSPESIARQTLANLTNWSNGKCLGDSCHCAFDCSNKRDQN